MSFSLENIEQCWENPIDVKLLTSCSLILLDSVEQNVYGWIPEETGIISVAVDAPQDVISTLSGKIGNLKGVSAKTVLSNVISDE